MLLVKVCCQWTRILDQPVQYAFWLALKARQQLLLYPAMIGGRPPARGSQHRAGICRVLLFLTGSGDRGRSLLRTKADRNRRCRVLILPWMPAAAHRDRLEVRSLPAKESILHLVAQHERHPQIVVQRDALLSHEFRMLFRDIDTFPAVSQLMEGQVINSIRVPVFLLPYLLHTKTFEFLQCI